MEDIYKKNNTMKNLNEEIQRAKKLMNIREIKTFDNLVQLNGYQLEREKVIEYLFHEKYSTKRIDFFNRDARKLEKELNNMSNEELKYSWNKLEMDKIYKPK